MEQLCKYRLIIFMICMLYSRKGNQEVQASPVGDSLVNSKLDSRSLISMGKALNKPVLTLLGMTFEKQEEKMNKTIQYELESVKEETKYKTDNVEDKTNNDEKLLKNITAEFESYKRDTKSEMEAIKVNFQEENEVLKSELCKLKSCSEWTEWSICSAKQVQTFGVSFRSRTCGINSQFCTSKSENKIETEKTICQGKKESLVCPSTYTLTTNQFCIRVRNEVKYTWEDARYACNRDGGHLINIDSELKAADVNGALETMSFADYTYFWIEGQKTPLNTTWQYAYGSGNIGLSLWYNGEPNTSDTRLIYYKVRGIWYLYGVTAGGKRHCICEIIGAN